MNNYEQLEVFQKSHALVLEIYNIIDSFPSHEKFRIVDQMIRSAYSVPSNIVEDNSKNTTKEYLNFLYISRGSIYEIKILSTFLSRDLSYIGDKVYQKLLSECDAIGKMLNAMINSLKRKIETK